MECWQPFYQSNPPYPRVAKNTFNRNKPLHAVGLLSAYNFIPPPLVLCEGVSGVPPTNKVNQINSKEDFVGEEHQRRRGNLMADSRDLPQIIF